MSSQSELFVWGPSAVFVVRERLVAARRAEALCELMVQKREREGMWGWGCSCVDFCGRSFLVDGLLAQVVTSFIFLLDAENEVNQQDDEEDGEDQTNCSACNNG